MYFIKTNPRNYFKKIRKNQLSVNKRAMRRPKTKLNRKRERERKLAYLVRLFVNHLIL